MKPPSSEAELTERYRNMKREFIDFFSKDKVVRHTTDIFNDPKDAEDLGSFSEKAKSDI